MEKVARLVKLAKDKHLADNERLGTVDSAASRSAAVGAKIGAGVGALGGAAYGVKKGISAGRSPAKKVGLAIAGGLAGAAAGGAGLGAYGGLSTGFVGLQYGLARKLKRAVMGQKSVSHDTYNARKAADKD